MATPSPLPTATFPAPSGDAAAGIGPVIAVRSEGDFPAADATRVAAVIGSGTAAPPQFEVLTIATGARTRIAHSRVAIVPGVAMSAGTLAYYDAAPAGDGGKVFGIWRIALQDVTPTPVRLDEFPAPPGFVGGRHTAIDPWPDPKTNGRDVVWLRMRETTPGPTHELVVARGSGTVQVIFSSRGLPFYAMDDLGRIAILTGPEFGTPTLSLYDPAAGRVRELARPAAERWFPSWVNGKIALTAGGGPSRADLYDPATGASTAFVPPTGCQLAGTTGRHVLVRCLSDLIAAHDLVTGRIVPLAPFVIPYRDALLMRSTAEYDAGPSAWLHATVLPR